MLTVLLAESVLPEFKRNKITSYYRVIGEFSTGEVTNSQELLNVWRDVVAHLRTFFS